MARHYDWSPLGIYQDPIPGDPQVLRDEATKFRAVASDIREAAENLRAIANSDDSKGEFVEEFAVQANEVADRISKAEIKYTGLADAISGYAGPLERVQQDSVDVLNRAINSKADAASAAKWETHWRDELLQPDLPEEEATRIQKLLDQATLDRETAEGAAYTAAHDLEEVGFERDREASAAAAKIKETGDASGINDTGWDNWVQFWEENGELIDKIVEIAGYIAAAVALIALFVPGLNLLVLIVTAIVVTVTVLNAVAQASAGTKSVADAVVEIALALIPLGVGKVAGKLGGEALQSGIKAAAKSEFSYALVDGVAGATRAQALRGVTDMLADVKPSFLSKMISGDPMMLAQLEKLRGFAVASGRSGLISDIPAANYWMMLDFPVMGGAQEFATNKLADAMKSADIGEEFRFKSEMSW